MTTIDLVKPSTPPAVPLRAEAARHDDLDQLIGAIREVFAEITRYPVDILEPDADLEGDLGIDSVKLGEILGALRARFDVTAKIEPDPEELRSIRGVAGLLARTMASGEGQPPEPVSATPAPADFAAPSVPAAIVDPDQLIGAIREVFAEITRYPVDILEPDADLEGDLGIDSVKLGEILGALRARFDVTAKIDPDPEELRSIRGVAGLLARTMALPE